MPNQGPKGSPVNPLGFLEPDVAPSPTAPQAEMVIKKDEPQEISVDSPEYASAIVEAIQIQPDASQMLGKLVSLSKALEGGHDVKEVVASLISVVSQTVAVMAVKHMEAMSASQGDPEALEAIDQLSDIFDEIREIVSKIPMGSAQKGQLNKLFGEAQEIFSDFEDEEGDEG